MTDITPEYLEKIGFVPKQLDRLGSSFIWENTHEGFEFWYGIGNMILSEDEPDYEMLERGMKILGEMTRFHKNYAALKDVLIPYTHTMSVDEFKQIIEACYMEKEND